MRHRYSVSGLNTRSQWPCRPAWHACRMALANLGNKMHVLHVTEPVHARQGDDESVLLNQYQTNLFLFVLFPDLSHCISLGKRRYPVTISLFFLLSACVAMAILIE